MWKAYLEGECEMWRVSVEGEREGVCGGWE